MSVLFHPLRVRAIEPDTDEAVIVSFEVPEELRQSGDDVANDARKIFGIEPLAVKFSAHERE